MTNSIYLVTILFSAFDTQDPTRSGEVVSVIKTRNSGTRRRPGLSFWQSRFSYYSLIVFCETHDLYRGWGRH